MIIGTGQQTIIDLRETADEQLERAYTRGETVQDAVGNIILKTESMELVRERTGLLWLSGVLVESSADGLESQQRWNFEFLPNNGVDVIRDDEEISDVQACRQAANRLLELIHKAEEGQAA